MNKREVIAQIVERSVDKANELLASVSPNRIKLTDESREELIDKMEAVSNNTAEEILEVEKFLESDTYKRYIDSTSAMSGVVLQFLIEQAVPKDETIH